MSRIFTLALLAFLLIITVPAWADDWETYSSNKYGFSLDYPSSWEQQIDDDALLTLTYLEEEMPVIIAVMSEPLSEEDKAAGVEQVVNKLLTEIQADLEEQGLSDLEITDLSEVDLNGIPATRLSLSVTFMELIFMSMENIILWNEDNAIYLTYMAEDTVFDTHYPTWKTLMESFKLTNTSDQSAEPVE